jgi:hypothetical protein
MTTCDEVLVNLHVFFIGSLNDMSFKLYNPAFLCSDNSPQFPRIKDTALRLDAVMICKTPTPTERETGGPASTPSLY